MNYADELSDELAEEYGVPEDEMWAFLASCDRMGISERAAKRRVELVYDDA